MAVGPGGVFSLWSAGGVEEAGLDYEDEGTVVEAAVEGVVFGLGDLGERAAEVDGGSAEAVGGTPGDGLAESEVELEDAGAGLEFEELVDVGRGEGAVGDVDERGNAGVEEGGVRGGEVGEVLDVCVEDDAAAEGLKVAGEGVGDGLAATCGDWPARGVPGSSEDESGSGAGDAGERQDGVRGDTREESAGALVLEEGGGEQLRGHERGGAENGHGDRVAGEAQEGLGEVLDELRPVAYGRAEERAPGAAVVLGELRDG